MIEIEAAFERSDVRGAGGVGDDQPGLGQAERMVELGGAPPAIEQGDDRAGLERGHVGDDPARAVAHRDADAVALGDAARDEQRGEPVRPGEEIGEAQPLVGRDDRLDGAVEGTESVEKGRQGGREIGRDRQSAMVLAQNDAAPGPGYLRQSFVKLAVELGRQLSLLCLCGWPPYEAAMPKGEAHD